MKLSIIENDENAQLQRWRFEISKDLADHLMEAVTNAIHEFKLAQDDPDLLALIDKEVIYNAVMRVSAEFDQAGLD